MNTNELFNQSVAEISEEVKREMELSFAISEKIDLLLKARGLTQKQFAKMVGKTEPEVCRWLSGRHNFTIRTLAKISIALETDIVSI
ncbi:MAG: helix-turn-helix transcriptional regulator [Bacteroidales bacterium]|nr:helix-turn-helix transcriptional regulator [Bacteroidales bacterium]